MAERISRMREKLVNIHIPKTAGTSLRFLISDALEHSQQESPPVIGIDQPDLGMLYFQGLAAHAKRVLPRLFQPGLHMLSGHFRYRDIIPVLADRREQISLVTTLRDPIKRTISDYCYSISAVHDGQEAFKQAYPTFEHYTQNAGEMNKQFDFLRPFEDAPLDVTIESALQNLDFVGLTERFEGDAGQLLEGLGLERLKPRVINASPNKEHATRIFDSYHDMLQEVLAPDIALYEAIAARRRFPR